MPELRHDPFQRRWVIIATERTRRPVDIRSERPVAATGPCPFCPGQEHATANAIRTIAGEDGRWSIRVIPNKYPALQVEGNLERRGDGPYDRMNGVGAHEVIIETPRHEHNMSEMSYTEVDRILEVYAERISDLNRDSRFKYVLVFKNYGDAAGASLAHPHSQIIATPVTPRTIMTELQIAREHYQTKERCLYCDVIEHELKDGQRVVWADTSFVVLAPYASRFPFELMILPRQHASSFIDISPAARGALARVLRDSLRRLKVCLDDPPFNFMLHTSPNILHIQSSPQYFGSIRNDYHWHIEIIPRLTRIAGFEWGTGFYINPTAPELAAQFLRKVNPV